VPQWRQEGTKKIALNAAVDGFLQTTRIKTRNHQGQVGASAILFTLSHAKNPRIQSRGSHANFLGGYTLNIHPNFVSVIFGCHLPGAEFVAGNNDHFINGCGGRVISTEKVNKEFVHACPRCFEHLYNIIFIYYTYYISFL
jgi:hypothetical protein